MRGVVALALLVSLVSAGCFVEENPKAQAIDDTSSSTSKTFTRPANATAQAPTANLTADTLNGTAPLNVTFAINGTDADSTNLTWTLTLGNDTLANGTSLPANATYSFTEAGNHTVVLTVSDGARNGTANVTIVVAAGNATAAGPTEDDWVTFNADGTCDAKDEIDLAGEYIHERGDPPGTGYIAGDGTWLYEESNGIDGLQVGGAGEMEAYVGCLNPDFLIF